jgi:UDP-N-acetylglucosamine acyltransferase
VPTIHPTAIVSSKADIAEGVEISPYVIIGDDVSIGEGTWIGSHTVIQGPTRIGKDNRIFQFNSIGEIPQDKKYRDEPTEFIIGDRNVIREYCTFNRGTVQDIGKTVLGSDNWIMAYVHLAHDCVVGNNTIFANGTTLAGHVTIDDYAILGGFTLVHQFCRVGEFAFTGMGTAIGKDVPPYVMAFGAPAEPRGINKEGLKRNGFDGDSMQRIKEAYRILYRSHLIYNDALAKLESELGEYEDIKRLLTFCKTSERGLIR